MRYEVSLCLFNSRVHPDSLSIGASAVGYRVDNSVPALRRAHHVLSFILHFYVHTLPPETAIYIPPSLAVPLAHVSNVLDLPPVITYSDLVLYNWTTDSTGDICFPSAFSATADEQAFYRASAIIELRGVAALDSFVKFQTIFLSVSPPPKSPSR